MKCATFVTNLSRVCTMNKKVCRQMSNVCILAIYEDKQRLSLKKRKENKTSSAMGLIVFSQNSYVEAPTPNRMVFGGGALGR